MKTTAKLIALILSALMTLTALSSCGDNTNDAPASQTEASASQTEVPETFELSDKVFDFDIEEYVKMPDLSKITIKKSELDDSVNQALEGLLDNYKKEYEKGEDEKVEEGDTTYIYYKGTLIVYSDECSFEAGNSGFAELDEAIVGSEFSAGTLTLTLTLGAEFTYPALFGEDTTGLAKELAGKTLTVEILSVGKTGKVEKGEKIEGKMFATYVFAGGTYDETSAAELNKKEGDRKGTQLVIGSGSFIDGFEDGMIGMSAKPDTKKVLPIAFPDPYLNNTAYSGKPVNFEVTIKSVLGYIKYDLDDPEDFAELKKLVEENEGKGTFDYANKQEMLDDLVKTCRESMAMNATVNEGELIKVEQNTLDEYFASYKAYYLEYYSSVYYSYTGMMPDEATVSAYFFGGKMDEELTEFSKQQMLGDLIIFRVAEIKGLDTVSKEDFDKYIDEVCADLKKYAEQTGDDPETFTPEIVIKEYYGGIRMAKKQLILERAVDWLYENIPFANESEEPETNN